MEKHHFHQQDEAILELCAFRAPEEMTLDGDRDKACWRAAASYPMFAPKTCPELKQPGSVKLAYNSRFFFVLADFTDDDVVQVGTENNTLLYSTGDLAELFLWPSKRNHYWEIYGTPNEKHAVLFFPGPGRRIIADCFRKEVEVGVAAKIDGTLNDYTSSDRGFVVEMAIPVAELTRLGDTLDNQSDWRVMVARYNYSATLPQMEYSATTELSRVDFHLRNEYAKLKFV